MNYANYSNQEYSQMLREEVREKLERVSYQPNTFGQWHPITQLATAYSAGIEAMVQLQKVYEVITDIRNVMRIVDSMHDQNLDYSVWMPSMNMLLERLPEWKESPVDDILKNHSMRVMCKQRYNELINKEGNDERVQA